MSSVIPTGRSLAALLPRPAPPADGRRTVALTLTAVAAITIATFAPTLHNGFLQVAFDDAIVLDTPAIRGLDAEHVVAQFSQFVHAHYVPLTLLSLAIDHALWGWNPFGYHLTNVLLHAVTTVLVWIFLRPLLPGRWTTTLATLVFAVHPLQLEAVTLAIQRKTVLSGAGFFLTLICYQRWRDGRGPAWYGAALLAFVAAALAKPIVVTLPLVLWLYEYAFLGGRLRWLDKLPFAVVAAAAAAAAMAAHAAVGAVHPLHGGSLAPHVVIMARVVVEYLAAALLPIDLAPIYYYRRALVFEPLNLLALASVVTLALWIVLYRRQYPWTFFGLAWFALTLLPESNLVPLAQLRADRFLYLGMVGVGVWIAVGLDHLGGRVPVAWGQPAARIGGALLVVALALDTRASADMWRTDVTAWTRVVERQPWSATAWLLLGHAHAAADDRARAEIAYEEAVRRDADLADAHLALARLAWARGDGAAADAHVRRYLALRPGASDGIELLAAMRPAEAR